MWELKPQLQGTSSLCPVKKKKILELNSHRVHKKKTRRLNTDVFPSEKLSEYTYQQDNAVVVWDDQEGTGKKKGKNIYTLL